MEIREFDKTRDADYAAFVRIHNIVTPDNTTTVKEMREQDERFDPRGVQKRWLAEENGEAVGACAWEHPTWQFHPRRFWLRVMVLPEHEGHRLGSTLYDYTLASLLESQDPITARCYIREDADRAVRFALERGWTEAMRDWESRLDVTAFDTAPWAEARKKPGTHGIAIRSLRELESDPDRDRKVWELENESARDVPSTEPYQSMPYERYKTMVLEGPNILPDAFIVAVEEATGKYVGSSNLWKRDADTDLQTGLTAVLREYRRMGIALAMKLRVIDYAKQAGSTCIRTENCTTNRPMLSINEALGYVKQPAWLQMVKQFAPEPDENEQAVETAKTETAAA